MKFFLVVLLVSLIFLEGCITRYPRDISLVSVQAVDYRQEPMLPAAPAKGTRTMIDPYRDFLKQLSVTGYDQLIKDSDFQTYFDDKRKLKLLIEAKNKRKKTFT